MSAHIYKIENRITHKKYIGKTVFSIQRRWSQHVNNAANPNRNFLPLYEDMNKYGVESFDISEIENVDNFHILSEREKYWISYYDTYNNGYNGTRGGGICALHDYDYIWQLWENGYSIKDIIKQIDCNDQVVQTVLNIHNVSTQERMDRAKDAIEQSHKKHMRSVYKMDVTSGRILQKFNSVSEAAKSINIDGSTLSKICKNSGITHGYKWEYSKDKYEKKDYSSKPVEQLNLQTGEVVNIYPSVNEAAKKIGGDSSYISKVCKGIYKSSKGFGWRFAKQ